MSKCIKCGGPLPPVGECPRCIAGVSTPPRLRVGQLPTRAQPREDLLPSDLLDDSEFADAPEIKPLRSSPNLPSPLLSGASPSGARPPPQLQHVGARLGVVLSDAHGRPERDERARPVPHGIPHHLRDLAANGRCVFLTRCFARM